MKTIHIILEVTIAYICNLESYSSVLGTLPCWVWYALLDVGLVKHGVSNVMLYIFLVWTMNDVQVPIFLFDWTVLLFIVAIVSIGKCNLCTILHIMCFSLYLFHKKEQG